MTTETVAGAARPDFYDDGHRYELELASGRVQLPSVTQILEAHKLAETFGWLDPYYAERGKAVHAAVAHWLRSGATSDELDELFVEPLDEDVRRLVLPALEVCEALALEPVEVEASLADPALLYAGTADVLGIAHRRAYGVGPGVLGLDWKANLYRGRDLQLAGYWRLWRLEARAGRYPFDVQDFTAGAFLVVGLDKGPKPERVDQMSVRAELFAWAVRLYHHNRGGLL